MRRVSIGIAVSWFWLCGSALAEELPAVLMIATGGTIAAVADGQGAYVSGELSPEVLVTAVPALAEMARLETQQLVSIGSQDMTPVIWLQLAKAIYQARQSEPDRAIVITHGTDTLEETAFFLDQLFPTGAPIVLTGAARPATVPGADGPANLLDAVRVALSADSRQRGVLAVKAGQIHAARQVSKRRAEGVAGFESPNGGPLGRISGGQVRFFRAPERLTQADLEPDLIHELPAVAIVHVHAGASSELLSVLPDLGYKAVVLAGVGNGNASAGMLATLGNLREKGLAVVRSSRSAAGWVSANVEIDDVALGFVAAADLPPAKARILLMLLLAFDVEFDRYQALFNQTRPIDWPQLAEP
ncbi:MAG: asparaginase [Wenzhouxiangellaceae bacterium]|nr:MAG: asparaginase [Wenzhouxiangellaceae bacterium]